MLKMSNNEVFFSKLFSGQFLEDPGIFSHPESRDKISNVMVKWLCYSRIPNIK